MTIENDILWERKNATISKIDDLTSSVCELIDALKTDGLAHTKFYGDLIKINTALSDASYEAEQVHQSEWRHAGGGAQEIYDAEREAADEGAYHNSLKWGQA